MRNNQRRTATSAPQPSSPAAATPQVYAVPTEFAELPSRGRFYPEGHPLCGQKTVEIRFMTAREEDILASTALIKNGLVIDRLLENLLVPEIDPSTLLIGDKNAIMVAARISAYGREYNIKVTCPLCTKENDIKYDLHDASHLEECFDEAILKEYDLVYNTHMCCYNMQLPVSKVDIGIKLITTEGERYLTSIPEENSITAMLSVVIYHVAGDPDRDAVEQFVMNMPAGDSRCVRRVYPKLVPNVEMKFDFKCESCHLEKEMEVPLTAEFFWPR